MSDEQHEYEKKKSENLIKRCEILIKALDILIEKRKKDK